MRFKIRHPYIAQNLVTKQRLKRFFLKASENIIFTLSSGHNDFDTGLPLGPGRFMYGCSYMGKPGVFPKARVIISFELLEALMRTDLTPAERAIENYRLANTMIHETAVSALWLHAYFLMRFANLQKHAFFRTIIWDHWPGLEAEPFFEDEIVSEL